jgi:hypothetical protein
MELVGHIAEAAELVGGDPGIISQTERWKATLLGGIGPPSIRIDWLLTPVEQFSGMIVRFGGWKVKFVPF